MTIPEIPHPERLFPDRVNFRDPLTAADLETVLDDPTLKVLQCYQPVSPQTWQLLDEVFFSRRPDVQLRLYSFFDGPCDLSFLPSMPSLRHLSVDCMFDVVGLEHIAALDQLESLGIGIYHLTSFEFLNQVAPGIKSLFLGMTFSKKPNLSPLSRFRDLQELYLEGQQKNIGVIGQLGNLQKLVLRSISTPGLDYVRPLKRLWSLDLKIGGIRDLSALAGMNGIKSLELWMVKGLANLSPVSEMLGLQSLSLESQRQVAEMPRMEQLTRLRRISLLNLRGLRSLANLEHAPNLELFFHFSAQSMQPEDYLPVLRNPHVRVACVDFISAKKNSRFVALAHEHHKDPEFRLREFEFE